MRLRNLELKDAPLMLEWMHDPDVVKDLCGNFLDKSLDDAKHFIKHISCTDLHLAIVSDEDEYMGTVSLKYIDKDKGNAEFAIAVRKCAMGKGYSWYGMKEIINKAILEYRLTTIYWCVSKKNDRAIRFYEKHGFETTDSVGQNVLDRYREMDDLKWYAYKI